MIGYNRYLRVYDGKTLVALCSFNKVSNEVKLKISTETEVDRVYVSDGVLVEKHPFNSVIALDLNFLNDVYVALETEDKTYFSGVGKRFLNAGELIEKYKEIQTKKTFSSATEDKTFFDYDDEKIAEENYFSLNGENEQPETVSYAGFKTQDIRDRQDGESRTRAYKDDALDNASQKGGKDSADNCYGDQREKAFYEFGDKEKRRRDIEKMLSSYPKEVTLCAIFPFGDFCVAEDHSGVKTVIGKISAKERTYYCVGRRGNINSPDISLDTVFFIPENALDGESGYLMSFILEDGADYIKKRRGF